ncbi:hypothetical protein [Actinomadura formosensis]|uniref:hypothetical protein n=1 Tax=Actinomadura formosensis TaxID=60706 RepID=UPI003D901CCD
MSPRVVRLDLRDCDAEQAAARVAELLRTSQDLGMLLVEDTAAAVVRHRAAFEALDASRQVGQLLCLVVGRQARDVGAGPAVLRLPGNIQRRTLWVIEETGVDWPLRAAARARRRDGRDGTGLGRLSELLRLPGVFERTCRLLGEVPFGVAVPGLWLTGTGGSGQEDFLLALRSAIRRMLAPVSPPPVPREEERSGGRVPLRLTGDGVLRRALDDAEYALEDAQEAAVELPSARALLREVPADVPVRAAGDRLAGVRARLTELFQAVPGDDRITEQRRGAIAAHGVEPPPMEPFEAGPFRAELHAWLRESLAGGASLIRIDHHLGDWAEAPEGSAAHLRRLRRICPDELLDRLGNPAPMPPPRWWLAVAGAACAALAGLTPLGVAGGLVMALLWTALVALTVIRGPGGRLDACSRELGLNAFGALAGAIGGGLGGAAGLPAAGWSAALAAAVAGALAAVVQSWRSRAIRWADGNGLDEAEKALQDMQQLLGHAVTGWARLNRRLDVVDELNVLRQGLGGVREKLDERATDLDKEDLGQPSRSFESYAETVRFWLGDLVGEAVRPASRGTPGDAADRHARREAGRFLDDWESVVEQGLPVETVRFVTDPRPVASVDGEDLAFLIEQLSYDPAGEMWQLCAPEDLGLLDTSPGPRTVRFGPRSAAGGRDLPPDTVLVSSSAHCGVLRLVPLSPHVVEWTWVEDGAGDEPGHGAGVAGGTA